MMISNQVIEDAIDGIASVQGMEMNPNELVEDVILVAYAFRLEQPFKIAIVQTIHSLKLIVRQRDIGQALVSNYNGWYSFHLQSIRANRHKADMRIVYQEVNGVIRVRGFGHRYIPRDVYDRIKGR